MQLDNENWPVNTVFHGKHFCWKIIHKIQTFPDSFLKTQNWVYLWINSLRFYEISFYCMLNFRAIEMKWDQAAHQLLSPYIKLFKKIKRGLELVSLPHFLHDFWRKIFLLLYSISTPNFIVSLPLIREILTNLCIIIVC